MRKISLGFHLGFTRSLCLHEEFGWLLYVDDMLVQGDRRTAYRDCSFISPREKQCAVAGSKVLLPAHKAYLSPSPATRRTPYGTSTVDAPDI